MLKKYINKYNEKIIFALSILMLCVTNALFINDHHTYQDAKMIWSTLILLTILLISPLIKLNINKYIYIYIFILVIDGLILALRENSTKEGYVDFLHYMAGVGCMLLFHAYKTTMNHKIKFLFNFILAYGLLLVVITLFDVEKVIGINIGTGNANLTAYHIFTSCIIAIYAIKNTYLKILYLIISLFVIGFILKARVPTVMLTIYFTFMLYINVKSFKLRSIYLIGFILIFAFLAFSNQRFIEINHDIYIRLYSWIRLIECMNQNIIFGYGYGMVAPVFNLCQNSMPEVTILIEGQTHFYAHNILIDKLITTGIVGLFLWIAVLFFSLYAAINLLSNKIYSVNQPLATIFIFSFIFGLYDITWTQFSSLVVCLIISSILLKNHFENSLKTNTINIFIDKVSSVIFFNTKIFMAIFFILCFAIIIYTYRYSELTSFNSQYSKIIADIANKKYISNDLKSFNKNFPDYGEVPTIVAFDYLFNTERAIFDKNKLFSHLDHAAEYNKFYKNRLHISSQYYAFSHEQDKLMDVYSDIYYKLLVSNKVISIGESRSNYKVISVNDSDFFIDISDDYKILKINKTLLNELFIVNSSIYNLSIPDDVISKIIEPSLLKHTQDILTKKSLLTKFLTTINDFGKPLVFNK